MSIPDKSDFEVELEKLLSDAQMNGKPFMDVQSGELHRLVGGYPAQNHRMPTCCQLMRETMQPGDVVLDEPPKGQGATLLIRYKLPR